MKKRGIGAEPAKERAESGWSDEVGSARAGVGPDPTPRIERGGAELEKVEGFDRRLLDRQIGRSAGSRTPRAPDAWAAVSRRSQALLSSDPEVTRRVLEIVIGADDRVPVSDASIHPWRCICSLHITAADGSPWSGTGWLVGPRLVVTAGHVVYMAPQGGWVREIQVRAGATPDGAQAPRVVAREFRSVSGWVRDGDEDFDYGAIVLPPEHPLGTELGYFGVGYPDAAWLAGVELNLSGYPADKPEDTQWYHARRAEEIMERRIWYNIDTAGGQSGAPVWVTLPQGRFAVAIHSSGAITGNSAVRITPTVATNLLRWAQESGS